MKLLKEFNGFDIDFAIFGIGFESRSSNSEIDPIKDSANVIAIGYDINTEALNYQRNLSYFKEKGAKIIEGDDKTIINKLVKIITKATKLTPINVLIDISVLSRHRLASVIFLLLSTLKKGSRLNVTYSLSDFVDPPTGTTPIRHLGEITPHLMGSLGDLSKPSSVILPLGYEKGKAAGVINFLDPDSVYLFIPNSPINKFKSTVIKNNIELIESTPKSNIFEYDVCDPYSTYLSLRSLTLSIRDVSRPLIIPLGPKVISSLSVLLGKELFPEIPVWRVSSQLLEKPVDRTPSGIKIQYTIEI